MARFIVRCPRCGRYRKTDSEDSVKCFACGRSFKARQHVVSENVYKRSIDREVGFK
ncbi:hypothetical protein M1293_00560 [Candidatus Parvarchaeota archaeon]|nr:hypothetical protein [Candidatus Parvarchaeota archaeon]